MLEGVVSELISDFMHLAYDSSNMHRPVCVEML